MGANAKRVLQLDVRIRYKNHTDRRENFINGLAASFGRCNFNENVANSLASGYRAIERIVGLRSTTANWRWHTNRIKTIIKIPRSMFDSTHIRFIYFLQYLVSMLFGTLYYKRRIVFTTVVFFFAPFLIATTKWNTSGDYLNDVMYWVRFILQMVPSLSSLVVRSKKKNLGIYIPSFNYTTL